MDSVYMSGIIFPEHRDVYNMINEIWDGDNLPRGLEAEQ